MPCRVSGCLGRRSEPVAAAPLSGGVFLGGVSVLVVDNCKAVRATITAMLEHFGAAVTAVGSADEALAVLVRERPDVLVSALAMPDKGGYWLIGRVRALPPERGGATPAAALTGFTGAEHRASILRAGFQYHVEKPVSLEKLGGIVALLALKDPPLPRSSRDLLSAKPEMPGRTVGR